MSVTVIGTGNMGRAISRRLARGGAEVLLVGKDFEATRQVAAEAAASDENGSRTDDFRKALAGTARSIRAANLADALAEKEYSVRHAGDQGPHRDNAGRGLRRRRQGRPQVQR